VCRGDGSSQWGTADKCPWGLQEHKKNTKQNFTIASQLFNKKIIYDDGGGMHPCPFPFVVKM